MKGNLMNLTGEVYDGIEVLYEAPRRDDNPYIRRWVCRYPNGEIKTVSHGTLRARVLQSEGSTPLYKVWTAMKSRCQCKTAKSYPDYGARGIKVCDEWQTYKPFKEWSMENGYKEGLSIDRIDNNGDYCPTNCRWSTRLIQQNNTRKNRPITINGETHNAREWSRIIGISISAFLKRVNKGWTGDKLLSPPDEKYRH